MEEKNSVWGYILVAVVTIVIGVGIGLGISYFTKEDKEPNVSVDNDNNWEENNNQTSTDEQNENESDLTNCLIGEVEEVVKKYLTLSAKNEYSPESVINEINLVNEDNSYTVIDGFRTTSIKYNDFKTEMMKYMTDELFANNFTKNFINHNGELRFFEGGATGYSYKVEKVTLKENNTNKYIVEYYVYSVHEDLNNDLKLIKKEFEIKEVNNKCVISSIEDK